MIEKQIQQMISYVKEELADIWKENMLEDLESDKVEFESAGEFLLELKKEFGGGDEESIKVAELRRIEQKKQQRNLYKSFKEQLERVNMKKEH